MRKSRESDELDMFDQVDKDFAICRGALELLGTSDQMEDSFIPVFHDLVERIDRIHGQYQKLYDELYPMPNKEEICKRLHRQDEEFFKDLGKGICNLQFASEDSKEEASEEKAVTETPEAQDE